MTWATMDEPAARGTTPGANPDSTNPQPVSNTTATTTFGAEQNKALMTLLDDPNNFAPNSLNDLRQPTYKFRLFMTTEHELITSAGDSSIKSLYATLDQIPTVTIAESGVTAGFNINSVEIDQSCGPGWRNASSYMTGINMTITEPLGSSLVEAMMNAAIALNVQDFGKMWYFLELVFQGYDEDGDIETTPLSSLNLENGGRWVYQIAITNMEVNMNESGASYKLTCMPYSMHAFDDQTCGRVPEVLSVNGGTIQDFCNDFATKLTKSWTDRYLGEIYTFKINIRPLVDDNRIAGGFKLAQGDYDPIRNLSLDAGDGKTPHAQIPAGTTISDLIMFLYCHCEDAQKMMLDTTSPQNLEDGDGETVTYNKKQYRVPIVPHVEADVKVTGYDPITGLYMKEITYHVWGYRSYTTNLSNKQYTTMKADPSISVKIADELRTRGYLRKRYEHRFTGLNTEVLRFDLDYNFAFSTVLPKITGWREGINQTSDHAKRNPALTANAAMNTAAFPNETTAGTPDGDPLTQAQSTLVAANDGISEAEGVVNDETATPAQKNAANSVIAAANRSKQAIQEQVGRIRANDLAAQKASREQIEAQGPVNIYAEDAVVGDSPFKLTYVQGHGEASSAAGTGFLGQWHRGASLAGAVLNQLHEPLTESLANITLEIRGDPYWIGYSHLERRSILNDGLKHNADSPMPNYTEGDSTLALILRFPSGIDPTSGAPIIREDDVFNGLYRVTSIKSAFSGGEFKQTLEAFKLELITMIQSNNKTGAQPAPGDGSTGQQ